MDTSCSSSLSEIRLCGIPILRICIGSAPLSILTASCATLLFPRIGIRSIEFRGADGLYINGKPFGDKLMGVNRHQDYAYIGNAVPNNLHWLDVKKMRDAGFRIIRSAHYPQDPAFMDACDELGMFIIVATPGWQYWNPEPVFEERILPTSVIWSVETVIIRLSFCGEPVLNETAFPESFAQNAYRATHEEYPAPGLLCCH